MDCGFQENHRQLWETGYSKKEKQSQRDLNNRFEADSHSELPYGQKHFN